MRYFLEQFPALMILLGVFNAHNALWRSEKMSTYDGCKSTIDLTLANLTIAPDYKWNKE